MVTNQRRNPNPILIMMIFYCCLCPDFGLSKPTLPFAKRQMAENRVEEEPNRTYINPIFEKCTRFSLGKRKDPFQNVNICDRTTRIDRLQTSISHMWCDINQLIKVYSPTRARSENSTGIPRIHSELEHKEVIKKIFRKITESVTDISKIQQEYLNADFDQISIDMLKRLEEINNRFKTEVIKNLIFNARCEEIELCPIDTEKSFKVRKKLDNNYSPSRFKKKLIRLLKHVRENLLESLEMIRKPNEKLMLDREAC